MNEWREYFVEGNDYVSMHKWGKDHWSTFAYFETRVVDNSGIIDNRRMRCNPRLHRELANYHPSTGLADGSKYPSILAAGAELPNHDDWSCLEDMVAAGLVKAWWRTKHHDQIFGFAEAKVEFTENGYEIAAMLRRHKAEGGSFSTFRV